MVRRILAVALLRTREGARGPLVGLLLVFLVAAVAATLAVPGEPGPERQRAVDGFVLDVALLVVVLAAAVLGAGSLAGDREARRDDVLAASAVRRAELLVGGLLGHGACLAILGGGIFLGTLSVTGLLAGGPRDRAKTRLPLRAEALFTADGEAVVGRWLLLTPDAPEAVYVLDDPRERLEEGARATTVWIQLRELVEDLNAGLPHVYPVGVRVGDGPERIVNLRTGNPIRFDIERTDIAEEGGTPISVRRIDPAYALAIAPGGLVVQGRMRSFSMNVAKALVAWLLGALVVAAAATALSSVVGAPVALAGGILTVLVGRALPFLTEAAENLAEKGGRLAVVGRGALEAVGAATPDFHAYDLTHLVTTRWSVDPGVLLERLGAAAGTCAVLLAVAHVLLTVRRSL